MWAVEEAPAMCLQKKKTAVPHSVKKPSEADGFQRRSHPTTYSSLLLNSPNAYETLRPMDCSW